MLGLNAGTAYVQVRPSMAGIHTGIQRGLVGVDRQFDSAGQVAGQKYTRSFGSRFMSGLGTAVKRGALVLGTVGVLGAAAFAKNAISLEQEFGKTMNQIQAATNTPAKGMRQLSDLALKMGRDTTFSASDAGKAMLELAHGGMNAATIQGGALKGTLTLAAAGELDMSEAANTAVKSMGQFGLKGKDMASIAAALAGAANASSASVSDMSQALAQGGLAANSVGFSIQETTGILAAFSNKGLEGSDAGTSMKTALDRLVPSTKTAFDAMKNVNLITEDGRSKFVKANGEYKSAAQVAQVLKRATDDLSSSERKRTISAIFGSDAQRAATILADEGAKGIREMTKATSDQGAAQRMAQANMKGTAGAIEGMKGSMETAGLSMGVALRPVTIATADLVGEIADRAIPYIQKFGTWLRGAMSGDNVFKDISGWVHKMLPDLHEAGKVAPSVVRGLTGTDAKQASGGLADIGKSLRGIDWSKAGGGLHSIGESIKNIDWASVRSAFAKGTADTVNVFAVAIGFLADHLDTLAKWMPAIVAGFIAYKAAQASANAVGLVHLPIAAATVGANVALASANRALATQMAITNGAERVGMLTRIRTTAVTVAKTVAEKTAAGASKVMAGAQWLLNAAMSANPIALVIAGIVALVAIFVIAYKKSDTFRRIVNAAWDGIKKAALAVVNWFKHDFVGFFTKTIPGAFHAVVDWVKKNWPLLLGIVTGPIGLMVVFIIRHWDTIKAVIKAAVGKVKDWIGGAWSWIKDKTSSVWNGIKGVFTGIWNAVIGFLKRRLEVAKYNVSAVWGWISDKTSAVWGGIQKFFTGIWDGIVGFLKRRLDVAKYNVLTVWNWIKDKTVGVWNNVRGFLGGIIDKIKTGFSHGIDGIKNIWDGLKAAAASPVNFVIETVYNKGIRGFVNGVLDKFGVDMKLPYALPLNWNRRTAGASTGRTAPGFGAASGAVLPGFTPGRDVHRFRGPRGMTLDLSGGEAVMVPEWTKMVGGPQVVARMNKAARAGRMQFARGGVVWPVPGHDVSTYPGHDGIDINRGSGWDDFGDPIRAALAGKISYVGTGRGYGTGIFTKGSYGELVYGHTSRQHVRGGQFVDAGTLIGNVGNTGNSSAPHLHFGFPGGTSDQARAVLNGAIPSGAGAGGGGGLMGALVSRVVGWLAEKGKGLLSKVPGGGSVFGELARGVGRKAIDAISATITSRFGGMGGGVTGDATPVNANARLGRRLSAARGWARFWPSLNALVMGESGWRNTAQNPTSTAYGIGQFLDSTWAGVGGHKTSDARLQIQYMLRYIAQRYVNPARAWAFKQAHNWYDRGGILPKGLSLARNDTGRNEHMAVFTNAQWRLLKQAITRMTLGGGGRITTDWLSGVLDKVPKSAEQLRSEFLRTRDAMRGFRTRTEQARARLEEISGQRRVQAAHTRLSQIGRQLENLGTRRSIGRQIRRLREGGTQVSDRDVNQAQRNLERAQAQLHDAASKKQRREANQAVQDAQRDLKQAERGHDREAAKAQRRHKKEIERLKERRDEVRKLRRERRQLQDSAPIQRQERAQARLNKALEAEKKARDRANAAAKAYRAAQDAALERARSITETGVGLGSIESAGFKTSGGIVSNLRRAVVTVKDWGGVVRSLIGAGLRGPILEEFIGAGPSAEAVRTGKSLLAGGQIAEINTLQDQLRRQAIRAGATAAASYTPAQRAAIRRATPIKHDAAHARAGDGGGVHTHVHGMPSDTADMVARKAADRVMYQLGRAGVV